MPDNPTRIDVNAPVTAPQELVAWVTGVAELTRPKAVYWCDGSQEERDRLYKEMVDSGALVKLDQDKRPGCYLARSNRSDVDLVEARTFICSQRPEDSGPTNHWAEPDSMKSRLAQLFDGCMRGRIMYVIPFSMGPVGGETTRLGIEVTDSPYVVVSMRMIARMGTPALTAIAAGEYWEPAVHSVGYPLVDESGEPRPDVPWPCNDEKYITHFPETDEIWSFGSGYGGNSLLSKQCLGLRIASAAARDEGWLAEHMAILRVKSPDDVVSHVAAAFPSNCGKASLATMRPAVSGWKVETIGTDVAWMRVGSDGRLRAVNPEIGLFGIAPGLAEKTNPVLLAALGRDTLFTNVALTDDGDVWWEGLTDEPPAHLVDWEGNDWTPDSHRPAAHPNARYTVGVAKIESMASDWDDPDGVPIDIILLGGRRATAVPLICESYSWEHGVFLGAAMSSERTAAEDGAGEPRHDPFAMMPFCGYNMADYWAHWLRIGRQLGDAAPHIFLVNWFRKDSDGKCLWPGFGQNIRPIIWALRRADDKVGSTEEIPGRLPIVADFDADGLDLATGVLDALFAADPDAWAAEAGRIEEFFSQFGNKLPAELTLELADLRGRVTSKKG